MSESTKLFDGFARHIKLSVHTFAPARIISYNNAKQEATVELLFKSVDQEGNAESYPPIEGVPVLGMRYAVEQLTDVTINGLKADAVDVDGTSGTIKTREPLVLTPFYKPNDVVFVAFAERALDNLQSKPFDPDSHRTHSLVDAVIIGGYQLT